MPVLVSRLAPSDLGRDDVVGTVDLTPYLALVDTIATGEGAEVAVDKEVDGNRRSLKRRITMAVHKNGRAIKWGRTPVESETVRFRIVGKKEDQAS